MKRIGLVISIAAGLLLCGSCRHWTKSDSKTESGVEASADSVVDIKCVGEIPVPKDLVRDSVEPGSFGEYLRQLPLRAKGYRTHLYDGREKANRNAAYRVVDMDIDSVDLQQCADACIRLYAEYLWHNKEYGKIKFHFVSGFLADYQRWAHGERIRLNAARTQASWYRINSQEDYSYDTFREYLLMVFTYAGTASLPQDLEVTTVGSNDTPLPINIGDVIVQPGSPGHAVIVVDKAGPMFILAQSYMPAQEIEILRGQDGPWNSLMQEQESGRYYHLATPEWNFRINDNSWIMHFKNQ